ncbi:MAG: KOW domain-containing RNA-binding protein [Clostridiales bacterium]|jgi:ribosomal protein L14E/L6E/L27E|nr:KOW domain-containing RNA-binding protein [Clostridiales bacterium]
MMDLKPGQIVISKAGRDKGQSFVVVATDGEYALLADGRTRPIARPKRKKRKHIQHTHKVDAGIAAAIAEGKDLKNSDFKTALEEESHG